MIKCYLRKQRPQITLSCLWYSRSSKKYRLGNILLWCNVLSATDECWGEERTVVGWPLYAGLCIKSLVPTSFEISQNKLSYATEKISPHLSLCPIQPTHPQPGRKLGSCGHSGIQNNRGPGLIMLWGCRDRIKCCGLEWHLSIPLTPCTDPATRPQSTTRGPGSSLPYAQKKKRKTNIGGDSSRESHVWSIAC